VRAVFAFIGLATVDLLFLLPVLFVVVLFLFIFGVVMIALLVAGIALVVSILSFDASVVGGIARGFAGVGLVAGGIGGGALLLLVLDGLVRMLGRYSRLHYRLLVPSKNAA